MGRPPLKDERNDGLKKGPWTPEEDEKLKDYIDKHGHGSWQSLPRRAGLNRCGKSCRPVEQLSPARHQAWKLLSPRNSDHHRPPFHPRK